MSFTEKNEIPHGRTVGANDRYLCRSGFKRGYAKTFRLRRVYKKIGRPVELQKVLLIYFVADKNELADNGIQLIQ